MLVLKKGITIYNLLHSTQLTVNCVSHMVERNKVTTVIDVVIAYKESRMHRHSES